MILIILEVKTICYTNRNKSADLFIDNNINRFGVDKTKMMTENHMVKKSLFLTINTIEVNLNFYLKI